jgi:nicotinate-nucleotide pyrophosphorylase (carboxylating)
MANNSTTWSHLLPPTFSEAISEWLKEDIPSFDYGGYVVGEEKEEAILYGKAKVCAMNA